MCVHLFGLKHGDALHLLCSEFIPKIPRYSKNSTLFQNTEMHKIRGVF